MCVCDGELLVTTSIIGIALHLLLCIIPLAPQLATRYYLHAIYLDGPEMKEGHKLATINLIEVKREIVRGCM